MAGTAVRGRLNDQGGQGPQAARLGWQTATVDSVTGETDQARTISLSVPDWAGHRAGQHLDVRLTAEDGYEAERSYSIASAPGEPVAITVERLDDGEVSPYLTEELRAGDEIELRGPIGGYFVWELAGRPGRRCCCWPEGRGSCRCGPSCGTGPGRGARSRCGCCTPRGAWPRSSTGPS